ncbi:hypothetical protein [Paenibacillus koleovorans]|uniref:hypothetical protein n=1 Tax=Paenibacillus koleovorans TaxID=121608 RepID=UPI000FD94113|nr:hypothetical protein [Paenibacillus koleovorans]
MANDRFHTITKYTTMADLERIQENWDTADADLKAVEQAINDEIIDRTAAIADEAEARAAADSAEAAAREAADNAEASTRASADANLQSQISANGAAIGALQTKDAQHDSSLASLQEQITTNEADIETKLQAHNDSSAAHDAENIGFTPGASGLSSVKAGPAIREVNQRITQIVAGAGASNTEILDARNGFATLDGRLDDADLYQAAIDTARAEMERQRSFSGVLDWTGGVSTSDTGGKPDGQLFIPLTPVASFANILSFRGFQALLNGYKTNVYGSANATTRRHEITLPAAPTYGTRDDLVFLEAWYPTTGQRGVLSWRIRTVAGVDFGTYNNDGFVSGDSTIASQINRSTLAQGGNASPLSSYTNGYDGFRKASNSSGTAEWRFNDDQGLYVAGDGTNTSKARLATADGYVYAIPLFRIGKPGVGRRNSGGWRADNPNGARDYKTVSFAGGSSVIGVSQQVTLTGGTTTTGLIPGDRLVSLGGTLFATILSIDSGTTMTINPAVASMGTVTLALASDRPDGLYSNIIDVSDCIDLRHRTPIRIDITAEVEAAFDATIRGALTTKDTKTAVRETYGLRRVDQLGLPQQLQAVTVKRADGTMVELANLFGADGNFEVDGGSGIGRGWNYSYGSSLGATISLSSNAKYGTKAQRFVSSGSNNNNARVDKSILFETGKYYLAVVDVNSSVSNKAGIEVVGSGTKRTTVINRYDTVYVKLQGDGTTKLVRCWFTDNTTTAITTDIDGFRLYEIPAAEYALIDVDANWTGGDKIAALYPYVDSLPNWVENLWDGQIESGTMNTSTGASEADGTMVRTASYSEVLPSTNYVITTASSSSLNTRVFYYDSSFSFINHALVGSTVFTTPSNVKYIRFRFTTTDLTIKPHLVKDSVLPNVYVPYGRWYLPADYQGYNSHLGNNGLIHYDGVNGSQYHANRSVFGDPLTSETRTDIVEALRTPQRHIAVTQASEGVWASGSTIKVRSDVGIIGGVIDADTGLARVTNVISYNSGSIQSVFEVDSASRFAVNDKIYRIDDLSVGIISGSGEGTVNSISGNQLTVTWSSGTRIIFDSNQVGFYVIETTSASSVPQVAYTPQQSKTAQSGSTSTTLNMAADASVADDYYNGLVVTIVSGTGAGQSRTITDYVGSTKVATVSAWSPTPNATSVYSISMPGSWAGLGTKEATFTVGTMPTATDGTLGNANVLNAVITYSHNIPPGKGLTNVSVNVDDVYVNDQRNVSGTTVSAKANFVGKKSSSTDLIPHVAYAANNTTSLLAPSSGSWTELSQNAYGSSGVLDGTTASSSRSNNLTIAQHLFSFDLIRLLEDKYGEGIFGGAQTVAEKVALLKANISIGFDWNGFGSGPLGNKATVRGWRNSDNSYQNYASTSDSTTSASVAKISLTMSNAIINSNNTIDANGFVHFIAYADASDGTTASIINTDYVELSITLNVAETGFTVLQPENPFPQLSENMLTADQARPLDLANYTAINSGVMSIDATKSKVGPSSVKVVTPGSAAGEGCRSAAITVRTNTYYSGGVWVNAPSGTKMQMQVSDTVDLTKVVKFTAMGSWQYVTATIKTDSSHATLAVFVQTDETPPAQAVTFYVDGLKLQEGAFAAAWTPGRVKKKTLNLIGKRSGSLVELPHRVLYKTSATFDAPSTFALELSQSDYDALSKQDGTVMTLSSSSNGQYPMALVELDFSHYGMSLSEMRKALRSWAAAILAQGSGDNASVLTNGATVKVYDYTTSAWVSIATGTAGTIETLSYTNSTNSTLIKYINSSQKAHILVHPTYPASATNASTLLMDYAKLDNTMADYVDYVKSNIVFVQPETKTVKLKFPARSYRYLGGGANSDVVSLNYRYVPYQGQGSIGKSKILAIGTPMISTLGTGAYPSDSITAGIGGLSTRLPSSVQDYNLIADKFTSEGVSTTIDSLTLKQNLVNPVPNGFYRVVPKAGTYIDPGSTLGETVVRGSSQRMLLTGDNFTQNNPTFKFSLPTTLPSEAVIYLPMIVVDNGEIKLIVVSFRKSKSTVLQYYADSGVYDSFRIPGRPLLRGV